jgi:hypothetical protein
MSVEPHDHLAGHRSSGPLPLDSAGQIPGQLSFDLQPRYFVKTSYHVWTVMDRRTYSSVQSIGARGIGDNEARKRARDLCNELNRNA